VTRQPASEWTPPHATRAPPRALVGVVLAAAVSALVAACSFPAVGLPAAPATTFPTSSTPITPTATPGAVPSPPGSLVISTPLPPQVPLDSSSAAVPSATAARPGHDGVTQRHTFAPSSITLHLNGVNVASASIATIDTRDSGELSLPPDPGQVGWWQSGALSGDAFGSVVLAGHIDSRDRGIGFFVRLLRVQPGDEVVLSDGTYQQRYRVVSTRNVPKASLATGTDTFSQRVPARLVLLTCTGPFNPKTHYPDNLVVTAEPIGVATPLT